MLPALKLQPFPQNGFTSSNVSELFQLVCVFHLHTLSEMKTSTRRLNFVFAIISPLTAVEKCEGYLFSSNEISKNRSLWWAPGKNIVVDEMASLDCSARH